MMQSLRIQQLGVKQGLRAVFLFLLISSLISSFGVEANKYKQTSMPGSTHDNKQPDLSGVSLEVYGGPSSSEETRCPVAERIGDSHYLTLHYNATIDKSSKTGHPGRLVDSTHRAHTKFPEPIMIRMNDDDPMLAWCKAMIGLCSGDYVYLVVPPELAYGENGDGSVIPGGATLRLDVHIVAAHQDPETHYKESRDPEKMFLEMDSDGDGRVTFEEMEIFLKVPADYPNRDSFLQQHFYLSDYNRDGAISLEEFKAILENWQGIDEL